ncbi:MAG: N-carbamoyl-D-amino-acid hydrolase [Chloroflexi bacterium]|nr:N-carbamoyl-D-amino-acid hydrolase [Chloroflexota bacterium]
MGRYLTVAAAQMGPGSENKAENVKRMLVLIKEAAQQKVDFIGFVELALTPFFAMEVIADYDHYYEEQMPSPLTEPLFKAAREANMGMVLPYAEKDPLYGRYYNSSIIVDCDGTILGKYRKTHVPGAMFLMENKQGPGGTAQKTYYFMEKRYFAPGDLGFPVFQSKKEGAKIGVLICFDRRFPEACRCLALSGAEVVFIPYNTPGDALLAGMSPNMNEIVLRTRAYEDFFYVVGVGRAGIAYGRQFNAGSLIAEAGTGDVKAMVSTDGDELVSATIDLDKVTAGRYGYHGFCERRPELYRPVVL